MQRVELTVSSKQHEPLWVEVDSGSTVLWIQTKFSDEDNPPAGQYIHDIYRSETASSHDYPPYTCTYADQTRVDIEWWSEHFRVGSLVAEDQLFGAAAYGRLSKQLLNRQSQGLMGLASWTRAAKGVPEHDNLVVTLAKQRSIKYASFSLVGPRNDPAQARDIDANKTMRPRGYLILGSLDRKYYSGEIAWCPRLQNGRHQWMVQLDEVWVNDCLVVENQSALIDTGTSYIITSEANFGRVMKKMNGRICGSAGVAFEYAFGTLHDISFVLGGRRFTLNPEDLSLGQGTRGTDGTPWMVSSIMTIGKGPQNMQFPEGLWVLGGILLDNIVTTFDFVGQRVGFATINQD